MNPADLFTCPRYSGGLRLLPTACALRWRKARGADPWDPGYPCRHCAIGAAHAGEPFTPQNPESRRCSWCGRLNGRLVLRRMVCVSCFNRALEIGSQTGRRGRPPLRFKLALYSVEVPGA